MTVALTRAPVASTKEATGTIPSILVLEPDSDGHQREYLRHLILYALADARPYTLWLAAAPTVCRDLDFSFAAVARNRIRLLPLRPVEERLCRHRLLWVRGFARWWVMRRCLRATGAQAGHFLSMDYLALPFALGLGMAGRRVSGILFRPSAHYADIGDYRPSRREWLRDRIKATMCRLMLRNRAIASVLSLDAYYPDFARRSYRGGEKVAALPDPAHPSPAAAGEIAALADELPAGRLIFTMFGYITERKGILALLAALRLLPPGVAARTGVIVGGRIDEGIRERVAAEVAALRREQPTLWIEVVNRRLGEEEIHALVRRGDVVLAPYQRFVGSSGVVLWAAAAGKPVLTQDFGLLGRLVRDHRLGVAVDTGDPQELGRAIGRMVDSGTAGTVDEEAARRFAAAHTPQRFAALVLASLLPA